MTPMLAAKLEDLKHVRYPTLITPKIDGIRCVKWNGRALTRSLKLVQNEHIRRYVEEHLPDGVDGEIVTGNFQETTSAVMSRDGKPDFTYYVFDWVSHGQSQVPYGQRAYYATLLAVDRVEPLIPSLVECEKELLLTEEHALSKGYEGIVIRDPKAPYKYGRSSLREGGMLKLKRMHDGEAMILGFEEAMQNLNPQVENERGYMHRPGGKSLSAPKGTLGSFLVQDIATGVEFGIGTGRGLTAELRQRIWDDQRSYLGKLIHYRCQKCGEKDRPRFPSFIGFREDM